MDTVYIVMVWKKDNPHDPQFLVRFLGGSVRHSPTEASSTEVQQLANKTLVQFLQDNRGWTGKVVKVLR